MTAEGVRIVEPEETAIAWERLCKHISMATKYACNNRRTVVGGFLWGSPQSHVTRPCEASSQL
jgi:hypothetical protein